MNEAEVLCVMKTEPLKSNLLTICKVNLRSMFGHCWKEWLVKGRAVLYCVKSLSEAG